MDKLGRYIIIALVITLSSFVVWYFSNVVIYVLISGVLSLVGKPLVDAISRIKFNQWQMPKWLSATITLLIMWGVVILLFNIFLPIIYDKVMALTHNSELNFSNFIEKPLSDFNAFLAENKIDASFATSSNDISSTIYSKISSFFDYSIKGVGSIIDTVLDLFVALFSISFITFFFLKEDSLFKNIVINLFPKKLEKGVDQAIDKSISLLSKYFIGLMIESLIKTILISVSLYFIGIDLGTAIVIALISGILNVIPYIGPLIGAILGVIIAFASSVSIDANFYDSLWLIIIIFSLFQLFDNIILQPYIYSSSVKAHPLEIFIVILLAGSLAGVVGMLLAIPAYTVLRVFAKTFFQNFSVVQKLTDKI
ncbi:MAG: AI-2E family transporter [Bacteroidetes bacterium]|nr:AI-2E family transporter [Bacteroidota bacterium]